MSKIFVNGVELFYQKFGTGEHVVLLLCGGLGFGNIHYKPQIEGFDLEKFTLISWDPRGYGQSRPPKRVFPKDFYYIDADDAIALMEKLGYESYSLLGWSDGAILAAIIGANKSEKVRKIVKWGGNAFCTPDMMVVYQGLHDGSIWSEDAFGPLLKYYGKEYFDCILKAWCASFKTMDKDSEGNVNICSEYLSDVKAPTLIIHGMKDGLVVKMHADFFLEKIKDSKLVVFDEGDHHLHLQFPEKFNRLAQEFLLE
uniref:Valacyclovir hydrolase-like n=1 Tax=Ciona intestinalis TaxID=7719 RepID=F6U176_CIOIN|nr:valacyclovir hydrolase-like isoform X1 [Ciona intestinalis]|eukprot:XP_002126796.1 valacyclovir hydrolase-like isoform X1 [Ciona intestinalis]